MQPAEKALTIAEFCEANRISRSGYFALKKKGRGPREMHVGGRIIIRPDANRDWRRSCEEETDPRNS